MSRKPTMADIARQAGVSRVAVSYALNGRPGVSDELRERILHIAQEVGFSANGPAQVMHGATVRAIGLTMRRPSAVYHVEVFRRELISGVQAELMTHHLGLALQFVGDVDEELAVYRRWSAERRVGGVLVCDLAVDDPRVGALRDMQLPAVVIGGPVPGDALASIWCDDAPAIEQSVRHLAELGHRRVARVSGPAALLHTSARDEAFGATCRAAGIESTVVAADYTGEAGAQVTRRLLSAARRPTAIVYDNDVMAVAALAVAAEMRLGVPADVSILAWEDSALCQVVRPAVTVLRRDLVGYGTSAAHLLLEAIAGGPPRRVLDQRASLVVRDSTGPATG